MVGWPRSANQLETPRQGVPEGEWWWRATARYSFSCLLVSAAALVRGVIDPWMNDEMPFLLQFCAVVASSALGGLGPGLTATLLGALAGYFLFQSSAGRPSATAPELRLFLLEGVLISLLGAWLFASRRRAREAGIANARLEKQMLEIGDNERRRFGHDLHDGLGQQLTGIALLSESLAHNLRHQSHAQSEQAARIAELVSQTIGWTRELARGLSPMTLETEGLAASLEELADRTSRLFGINVHWECELSRLPVGEETSLHIYRIVQEAISNSVKHGRARNIRVEARAGGREVSVIVTDDGGGLSAKTVAKPGIGLRIMQYRAKLIGARLVVARARPEGGTVVRCTLATSAPNVAPVTPDGVQADGAKGVNATVPAASAAGVTGVPGQEAAQHGRQAG